MMDCLAEELDDSDCF